MTRMNKTLNLEELFKERPIFYDITKAVAKAILFDPVDEVQIEAIKTINAFGLFQKCHLRNKKIYLEGNNSEVYYVCDAPEEYIHKPIAEIDQTVDLVLR
jgi:hypothetical protein